MISHQKPWNPGWQQDCKLGSFMFLFLKETFFEKSKMKQKTKVRNLHARKWIWTLALYTKTNSKWMQHINVSTKTIKLFEENTEDNFHDIEFGSKTLMLGKIEGRRRRGWQDEMVGWHHQFNGHEFAQAPGDGEAWCAAVFGVTKSWTWLSDCTTTTVENGLAVPQKIKNKHHMI